MQALQDYNYSTRVAKGDQRITVEHLPRLDVLIRETSSPLLRTRREMSEFYDNEDGKSKPNVSPARRRGVS